MESCMKAVSQHRSCPLCDPDGVDRQQQWPARHRDSVIPSHQADAQEDDFAFPAMARRRLLCQAILGAMVACVYGQFFGTERLEAQEPMTEYPKKADMLAKFPGFVRWPPGSSTSIKVGILGEDSFGEALAKMNVKRSKSIEELKDCQIIFIGKSERGNIAAILDSLGTAGILTVGESDGFAQQGGMIGFVMDGDTPHVEINTAAVRRAGLGIDLRLLRLARRVFSS